MSELWTVERVLELIEGDREILDQLFDSGICERRPEGLSEEEVDTARVARVLVRELEVNWPGVEIVLRLRAELMATQRRVAELLEAVRQARTHSPGD
jgi:hypothetical protein